MPTGLYKNGTYTRAELSVFKKPKEIFLSFAKALSTYTREIRGGLYIGNYTNGKPTI
jgi:hypothetical protein